MRRSFQITSGNEASVASDSTAAGDDGDGTAVHSSSKSPPEAGAALGQNLLARRGGGWA